MAASVAQASNGKLNETLLEKAREFHKDGQISHAEAQKLCELAQGESGVSALDLKTLSHTLETFKYTEKAAACMRAALEKAKPMPPQHKQIDGIKYDRELLDLAERFASDGQVSQEEAKQLWQRAGAGGGLCDIKRRTLQRTLEDLQYTDRAASFLESMLRNERPKGSLKHLGGVSYDRGILEAAEAFVRDGWVSVQEAQQLWEMAQDGGRVTESERRALEFVESTFRCTKPAAAFLKKMLETCTQGQGHGPFKRRAKLRWTWYKRPNTKFPAYPVLLPRKKHLFSLVLCHPMGWSPVFFLGQGALAEHLVTKSRVLRDHCKIICPGSTKHGEWKLWFRYFGRDTGGTRDCHAATISAGDMGLAVEFVSEVLRREADKLGSPSRVALAGYSQGGCVSLAVGLNFPAPLGVVISQRGMLMKQTMDVHRERTGPLQEVLMTAGRRDDIYLEANQMEAKQWLQGRGCRVTYKLFKDLNHGDHHAEEMTTIRKVLTRAFLRAAARTKEPTEQSAPAAKGRKRRAAGQKMVVSAAKKLRRARAGAPAAAVAAKAPPARPAMQRSGSGQKAAGPPPGGSP